MHKRRRHSVSVAAVAALAGLALAARAAATPPETITFGTVTCAPNWRAPAPGRASFLVANHSDRTATVYLFRAGSGAIAGQLDGLRAGARRRLTVRLRPGSYAWGCDLDGAPRHVSDAALVPPYGSPGPGGPTVVPVVPSELTGPLAAYRSYVAGVIG